MEKPDLELIEQYRKTNSRLNQLYQEHVELERLLEKLNNKRALSPRDEAERHELQKKKLIGRDKIEQILIKYRK